MKSEAEIKKMLREILNDRLVLAQTIPSIVAMDAGLRTPMEQRFMNGNAHKSELAAIDLQGKRCFRVHRVSFRIDCCARSRARIS